MSELRRRPGRPGRPCILYKDGEAIGTFDSIIEAAQFLESKIGGNLRSGIYWLLDGYVPSKRSQLFGYSAKLIQEDRN
ncbi:hypothetical protein [Bacillus cereus]|uniref:hypothetical protein n=1 Tax=Bacillus cereus TaxID=1396 RepID=UPI000D0FCDB8|nr:hypothetical protein [Bacillus cereus]AVP46911.1 hypothetical protein C2I25_18490 [Bacillus cereus]